MKTIYCIQSITGSGHHDGYAEMYCEIFAELGYKVVLLCKGVKRVYSENLREFEKQGRFVPVWSPPEEPELENVRPPLPSLARSGFLRRVVASGWRRVRRAAARFNIGLPPLRIDYGGPVWPTPRLLADITRAHGAPDFLYFMYLDEYIRQYPDVLLTMHTPWVGLLFDASCLENESNYYLRKVLRADCCMGLCFLYPQYLKRYKKNFPGKRFVSLPDVPDAFLTPVEPTFCEAIRQKASGRTIVLLAGSLAARKGMISLLRTAFLLEREPYYFVFGGNFSWDAFAECSDEEKAFLRRVIAGPPENCFFHFGYIADEGEFNHLFRIADIVFAVYERFDLSSGIIGKAAVFRKPVLVKKGVVMESMVMRGPFGETVSTGDPGAIAAGLGRICENRNHYAYDEYAEDISRETLRRELALFLDTMTSTRDAERLCPLP